jgi:hypothetical protein
MNETLKSKWRRAAAFIARTVVRLWPQETKDWGRAFAAELPEIEGFRSSIRWLMGGTMLLTRERLRHFLNSFGRPLGVSAGGALEIAVKTSMHAPRTPRVVTLLLLLTSMAILAQPEMRTCLSTALSANSMESWSDPQWRSVHRLENEAARTGDAKLFAILSLLSTNERHGTQTDLEDKAIAKDPSFTWLEYHFPQSEQTERLRKWDPDNAAIRLIPAELRFAKIEEETRETSGYVRGPGHGLTLLEKAAAADKEWLAEMDYGFSAPKYDTYTLRQLKLIRDVTRQYGVSDPDIAAKLLYGQRLPNFLNLRSYADIVLDQAAQAEDRGNTAEAMAGASKVLHFARNMQLHGRSSIEYAIAATLAEQACERLGPLLERAGRKEEAALVGFELAQWKAVIEGLKLRNPNRRESQPTALAWTELSIHVAAVAVVGLIVASLAGLTVLLLRNRAVAASRDWRDTFSATVVDLAPMLLLFATVTLFLAYHPYALVYQSYLERADQLPNAEAMESFLSIAIVAHVWPETIEQTIRPPQGTYVLWLSATVLLSALGAFLMYRMRPRRTV